VTLGAFAHISTAAPGSGPVPPSGSMLALALGAAAVLWVAAVVSVARGHPRSPIPERRTAAFLLALGALAVALLSPLDGLADEAYGAHMVQHLLLTMVAAPLLVLAAPVTLVLRASRPEVRRRLLLPILHARLVRVVAHPLVGWVAFVAVSWAVHLSPLFGAALANPGVHELEHLALLASGVLFWLPVVAADPVPWRLDHGARFAYVALALPLGSLLGLVIYSWPVPLWTHYVQAARAAGVDALADQRLAGAIMWVGGDMLLVAALGLVAAEWFRAERRRHRVHGEAASPLRRPSA